MNGTRHAPVAHRTAAPVRPDPAGRHHPLYVVAEILIVFAALVDLAITLTWERFWGWAPPSH